MLDRLIFVGFNSRVAALDRESGELQWDWKSPKGTGYVSVMLDGLQLIVSVNGYTYSLDPLTGRQIWFNELPGMGSGVTSLASVRGGCTPVEMMAAAQQAEQAAASATHTTTGAGH